MFYIRWVESYGIEEELLTELRREMMHTLSKVYQRSDEVPQIDCHIGNDEDASSTIYKK